HRHVALPPVDELALRRLARGAIAPDDAAVAGAQAVETLVAGAEGDRAAAAEDGGRVDDAAGLEAPPGATVAQRVEARVGRAGVDGLARADDRRAENALAGDEDP